MLGDLGRLNKLGNDERKSGTNKAWMTMNVHQMEGLS